MDKKWIAAIAVAVIIIVAAAGIYVYVLSDEEYTITYNANGGDGEDLIETYSDGTSITIIENTFAKKNYRFVEWNTNADGSGDVYASGSTFNMTKNITLYAQWAEITIGDCAADSFLMFDLLSSQPDSEEPVSIGTFKITLTDTVDETGKLIIIDNTYCDAEGNVIYAETTQGYLVELDESDFPVETIETAFGTQTVYVSEKSSEADGFTIIHTQYIGVDNEIIYRVVTTSVDTGIVLTYDLVDYLLL